MPYDYNKQIKRCWYCGTQFNPYGGQIYCTKRCRKEHYNKQRNPNYEKKYTILASSLSEEEQERK